MKKLMVIAAAMTIAAGVYGACTPEGQDNDCSMVYKVKMNLKAGRPKSQKGKCETMCYRTPTKVALQGYAMACEMCDCEAFKEDMEWILWSKKEKSMYLDEEIGAVEWNFLNIIGKKANELEGGFFMETYAFSGYGSGFGKLDKKFCIPSSLSGEFAGWGGVPGCTDKNVCSPSEACTWAYSCADYCAGDYDTAEGIDSELPTAYTGKWSMKLNKSLSKKYGNAKWNMNDVPEYDDFERCADSPGGTGDSTGGGEEPGV